MTTITIPNRPKPSDLRDINAILADFDAITAVVNGNLDSSNIKDGSLKGTDLEAATVAEDRLSPAVQTLLNKALTGLEYETFSVSKEGVSGKLYAALVTNTTITLPTPTANRSIGVICGAMGGFGNCKVTCSSGKIFGDFLAAGGTPTITLQENQHVLLFATGSNWYIIAGEPQRTSFYTGQVSRTVDVEYEPSTTRPAMVNGWYESQGKETQVTLLSNAAQVGYIQTQIADGPIVIPFSFMVIAGGKWKWHKISAEVGVVQTNYAIL